MRREKEAERDCVMYGGTHRGGLRELAIDIARIPALAPQISRLLVGQCVFRFTRDEER